MEPFTWSWSPLKLKRITERSYGTFYHIQFPTEELLQIAQPRMMVAQSDLPVTVMIKGERMASIYANDRLFPYYEGIMLQDARKVVTLTGVYNEIEVPATRKGDPSKWYMEFTLSDSSKKIKLSKTGYGSLFSLVGGDLDKVKGLKVAIYGEFGRWFKKKTEPGVWALRVDLIETAKLNKLPAPRF